MGVVEVLLEHKASVNIQVCVYGFGFREQTWVHEQCLQTVLCLLHVNSLSVVSCVTEAHTGGQAQAWAGRCQPHFPLSCHPACGSEASLSHVAVILVMFVSELCFLFADHRRTNTFALRGGGR